MLSDPTWVEALDPAHRLVPFADRGGRRAWEKGRAKLPGRRQSVGHWHAAAALAPRVAVVTLTAPAGEPGGLSSRRVREVTRRRCGGRSAGCRRPRRPR